MSGSLVIIGGHEDRNGKKNILSEVAKRARNKKIFIITTASASKKEQLADTYVKAFSELKVKEAVPLNVDDRGGALKCDVETVFADAGGVFFTGGDQLRLTSQLGDTPVFRAVRRVYDEGGVVAGTSAGASVLSDTMLVSGDSAASPRGSDAVQMAPGFDFIEGVVIDQHFAERGRTGRLVAAVAQNPKSIGLGIDEDTAVVVEDRTFRVIGSGSVYVFDASGVTYSEVAEVASEEAFSVFNVKLHILTPGNTFDLDSRRPDIPNASCRSDEGAIPTGEGRTTRVASAPR
jgi:cyanophycinase